MARALGVPSNLASLVKTTFAKALSGGDLHYFPTKVAIIPVNSVPFQLRFSPALANKPKPQPQPQPQDASSSAPKPLDPFANPPPALYIADVGPWHYLVLNKFAIVPEHFILATKEFKQQTNVLEEADVEATLACIQAFEETSAQGLFAFFNCGEHSGASQPHRHIQLLPIDRMRDGLESEQPPWNVLADGAQLGQTPFVVFSEPITPGMSGAQVHGAYLRLYAQACEAVDERSGTLTTTTTTTTGQVAAGTPTRISYNMAMTKNRLVICPRLAEWGVVYSTDGQDAGRLALNGTVLAGTALVKNEAEWDALRENPACLAHVLEGIGLPSGAHKL